MCPRADANYCIGICIYVCTYEGDTDSSAKEQNIMDEMYMYQNNAEDSQSGGLA